MAVALVAPALAHHSPAAFDRTKKVTLVGTVKEFRWQNPHTWIEVEVPDEKDKSKQVVWGVELTSPTYLIRAGWKSNTIKPGDKVTVVVNPVRSRRTGRHLRVADAGRRPRRCSSGRRVSAPPSRSSRAERSMRMMSPIRFARPRARRP